MPPRMLRVALVLAIGLIWGCVQPQLEFSQADAPLSSIVVSPTAPGVKAYPAITDTNQLAAVSQFLDRHKNKWTAHRGQPTEGTYMIFLVGPIPLEPIHAGYRYLETKVRDTHYRCELTDAEWAELLRLLRIA